jgi:Phage tail tube protein
MPAGIGAGGFIGIAHETTPGTYVAPLKYFPVDSEALQYQQDVAFRRPIRQTADQIGAVLGNAHVEGDLAMDFLEDVVPYFLYCARTTVTKTGTIPNFTYAFKGSAAALPPRTMSVTVIRNGQVFGYVGCVVGSFTINIDAGQLKFSASLQGRDEASQTLPTPTFSTTAPFGTGTYTAQVAGATISDADTYTFTVDDSAAAQNRIGSTRGAAYISYGERTVTCAMDRDFLDRTEYDAWKALTAQAVSLAATKGINNNVTVAVPVGLKTEYPINLGGQGDLLRVSNSWTGVTDASGNAYTVTIACQENIT